MVLFQQQKRAEGAGMLKAASDGRGCLGNFWDFFFFQIKVPGNGI